MSIQLKGLVNLGGWIELEQMTFQVSLEAALESQNHQNFL